MNEANSLTDPSGTKHWSVTDNSPFKDYYTTARWTRLTLSLIVPVPNTDQSRPVVLLRAINALTIKLGKLPIPLGARNWISKSFVQPLNDTGKTTDTFCINHKSSLTVLLGTIDAHEIVVNNLLILQILVTNDSPFKGYFCPDHQSRQWRSLASKMNENSCLGCYYQQDEYMVVRPSSLKF